MDVVSLPMGTDEELAGPPEVVKPAPVRQTERVSSIDTLRGFALMGILIMNITDFAYGFGNYAFPLSIVHPVFSGPHAHVNTTLWALRWVLAEGKMRGLFSLLFGAGVILLTERAEQRGAGLRVADVYCRRNLWLCVFGMLHAYLIWDGDILFFYGTAALIFLFPFRNVRVRRLLWTAGIVLFINSAVIYGGQFAGQMFTRKAAQKAMVAYQKNHFVTEEQRKAIDANDRQEGNWRKSDADMYRDIHAEQKSYWAAVAHSAKSAMQAETKAPYFGWGDWAGMMLLGMALYKNGFLSGKLRTKVYVWTAVAGLGISWPLIAVGAYQAWKSHFDLVKTYGWMEVPYGLGRVAGALGTAAVILLLLRAGTFPWLMKRGRRRRADGTVELFADQLQHAATICLEPAALVWLYGVLQGLRGDAGGVDGEPGVELGVAAVFSVWPDGVGLAVADILEAAADEAADDRGVVGALIEVRGSREEVRGR